MNSNRERLGRLGFLMRCMFLIILSGFIAGLCALPSDSRLSPHAPREEKWQSEAERAVVELWSADESLRKRAKERLIALGIQSVPPLVSLLNEIAAAPGNRYPAGKERAAQERLRTFSSKTMDESLEESPRDIAELRDLEISWRLKMDACDVLGEVKAVSAVPTLISLMCSEEPIGASEPMWPEMRALVKIGSPAVDALVNAIEQASDIAASEDHSSLSDEAKSYSLRKKTITIRIRVAIVLEKIGDQRALPALENLLTTSYDSISGPYLRSAVQTLRR